MNGSEFSEIRTEERHCSGKVMGGQMSGIEVRSGENRLKGRERDETG